MTTPYQAYGGYPPPAGNGSSTPHNSAPNVTKNEEIGRSINRTPSPTPSEQAELSRGVFNWRRMSSWRFWIRREWLWYYVGAVLIMVIAALTIIYHSQIVDWLTPAANWMKKLKFGYLIPIAVLFVISFPPLFGHEIVAIICGLVWGIGWGFAIVAAGTFLGEMGNFYAFKYCLRSRGEKLEKTSISYACLARIVRDGGIVIALIARLSAIPGHFTTAVFSTCGMSVIVFAIAAILSLPKQFLTVYLGVVLKQSESGNVSTKTHIINYAVIGITTLVTIGAMWYIYHKMNKVKPIVIYERRKARQAKLYDTNAFASSTSTTSLNDHPVSIPSHDSTTDIPLDRYAESPYQRWDGQGNAVGYAPDPRLHAPNPRRTQASSFDAYKPYGGPSPAALAQRSSPPQRASPSLHASPEPLVPTPGAPTRTIHDAGPYVPPLAPPPPGPSSPAQTPTQTQFATFPPTQEVDLMTPPLPTPTYANTATAQGGWGAPTPSVGAYAAAPLRRPSAGSVAYGTPSAAYNAPPTSFFAGQQPYQTSSQPGTPSRQPSGQDFVGFGHAQDGSGSTYYTAGPGHSRAGTDEHAQAYGANAYGANPYAPGAGGSPGPHSATSAMTNPYGGYASPSLPPNSAAVAAAAEGQRAFSPRPPTYRTTADGTGYGAAR